MRLGVVGRGYWGDTYCRALADLGIAHWQAGRDWCEPCDGLIVASSTESHYEVASKALQMGLPVLVEKPVCTTSREVESLIALGGIAFAGHTRLYSQKWRDWKRPGKLVGYAGGVNQTNPDPWMNWAPHLVAMAFDAGCEDIELHITQERQPLRVVIDGAEFIDDDYTALETLLREFVAAIERGLPDNRLRLAARVLHFMECYGDFHLRRVATGGSPLEQQAGVSGASP